VTSTPDKKKPPLIAILAVAIPLLALAVGAVISTTSQGDDQASSTTASMEGEPAATVPTPSTEGEPAAEPGSADKPAQNDSAEGRGSAGNTEGEVASSPQTAGGEGDRPVVTWPQPTVPAGGCDRPSGSTAVIALQESPRPACLQVDAEQAVEVQNRTGREISFMADGLNEIVPAGATFTIGRAADAFPQGRTTFWVQGDPKLSGLIEVG
jgi:hypothetical protein